MNSLKLSTLPKTWIIDVDGVIFVHNSHLDQGDVLIEGASEFISKIPREDFIILFTAREQKYQLATENSLKKFGIRYDQIIYDLPKGERVLINDRKPDGMTTAIAINTQRDKFDLPEIKMSSEI